jgi:hypothetical protein
LAGQLQLNASNLLESHIETFVIALSASSKIIVQGFHKFTNQIFDH